jgi:hypothetical protein
MPGDDEKSGRDCSGGDFVSLGPDLGGVRPYVRHMADHSVESGVVQMAAEGQPLGKDAVVLRHQAGSVYAVEPVFGAATATENAKGPAKVTSDAYRHGWEGIFGSRSQVGEA